MTEYVEDRRFSRRMRLPGLCLAIPACLAFILVKWPGGDEDRRWWWWAVLVLAASIGGILAWTWRLPANYRCGRCGAVAPIESLPAEPRRPWTFYCRDCDIRWVTTVHDSAD